MSKIRISVVQTNRITDCDQEIIAKLDEVCKRRKVTRVQYLRLISGNPLKSKQDVDHLRDTVRKQGFKSIEYWLAHQLGIEKEFKYGSNRD